MERTNNTSRKTGKLMATFFVVTLALMLIFMGRFCGMTASAEIVAKGTCGSDLAWTLDDNGTMLIEGNGVMWNYSSENSPWYYIDRDSIKNVIISDGAIDIGSYMFYNCSKLTSIDIPSSVTSIGERAFEGCASLANIKIPSSVTEIGYSTFFDCISLTSIEIPNSVTSIDSFAFYGCTGLTSIKIPGSVNSIGDNAFSYSGLTSIEIPNSVTSINDRAFSGCTALANITVDSGNTVYDSRNYCNAIIETESHTLIAGCKNTVIPGSVRSIGKYAFYGCEGLTSISIPGEISSIGECAFNHCSLLEAITIPSSVISINDMAFYYCEKLKNLVISNGVKTIGNLTFAGCEGLTSVEIPESVTSIGNDAFIGCNSLTSIKVDEKNKVYDSRDNCNVIIESNSNTLIAGCKTSIIPNNVTSLGDFAFTACESLISLEIPSGVTNIGYATFFGCTGLVNITIPLSVNNIGEAAFSFCDSLTIYGYKDSYAEQYAHENSINFLVIIDCTHTETKVINGVPANCVEQGYTGDTICAACGRLLRKGESITTTAHTDTNSDGKCDTCGKDLGTKPTEPTQPSNPAANCSHMCHKGGFLGFIWKIANLFNKLFKTKQYCSCGAKHW